LDRRQERELDSYCKFYDDPELTWKVNTNSKDCKQQQEDKRQQTPASRYQSTDNNRKQTADINTRSYTRVAHQKRSMDPTETYRVSKQKTRLQTADKEKDVRGA
jgi:hypothetical protein